MPVLSVGGAYSGDEPMDLYLDPSIIALATLAVFAVVFYFDSVLPKRKD